MVFRVTLLLVSLQQNCRFQFLKPKFEKRLLIESSSSNSGFYHDPNAGWYYCSKDGRYYKHENGEYVPLEYDESSVNPPGDIVTYEPSEDDLGRKCAFSQAENVENGCEVSLSNPGETPSGDDDAEELEEGEWIPEEDFDPQEENFGEAAPSSEEERWLAQYGQVIESPGKTLPEIPSVDLWDWKLVCETREADNEQVARLVGRLVRQSANLHPSVVSGGTLLKTAPICEARLHLVRVRTGQVYKLRNPSAKYLASLSVYDASNPTKDWEFPDISTEWQNPDTKRKAKKGKPKRASKLTVKPSEVDMIEEQRSCSYRDRAAERRNLHGGYGVGPGQKGTTVDHNTDEHSVPDTGSEEDTVAEALELSFGSGSYARRIMGNMGWKEVTCGSYHL
ncbi:hypothetical protein [Arabidopsis thaliana]|uniref:Uncharacterized protein AT4g34140 n=1 Tax=Arabidopsis thaliana TaxID=3702 RepID=O49491_ARATH|nr:hypothetical protein [Arabidopsis thaliana]CAB80131.1 hypothetical protein [Arabidopsis thaliana]